MLFERERVRPEADVTESGLWMRERWRRCDGAGMMGWGSSSCLGSVEEGIGVVVAVREATLESFDFMVLKIDVRM